MGICINRNFLLRIFSILSFVFILCTLNSCTVSRNQVIGKSEYNNSKLPSGEIAYQVPNGWQEEEPSRPMRTAQFNLIGDNLQEMDVYMVFLPGAAGGVQANLARWHGQFKNVEEDSVEQFNLGNLPITTMYAAGIFLKPLAPMMMAPNAPKKELANYAIFAAIAETKEGSWFFKAVGPKEAVDSQKANFDRFVNSFTI